MAHVNPSLNRTGFRMDGQTMDPGNEAWKGRVSCRWGGGALGFRGLGVYGFRFWGLGFRVWGLWGLGFRVWGGFRERKRKCKVLLQHPGIRVQGFRC